MLKRILEFYALRKRTIIITFEVFWIVVFILEMVANKSGTTIPQFVYVNF